VPAARGAPTDAEAPVENRQLRTGLLRYSGPLTEAPWDAASLTASEADIVELSLIDDDRLSLRYRLPGGSGALDLRPFTPF
jgi:hypothetical protein